jgi:plasmid stabilization system protein ParE
MPASVIFDASASREYLKARRWYAARAGEQIAAGFADEVDRAVVRIAESPTTGTLFRTRYRWVRLRRFPYLVYYREVTTDTLVVLAVAHKRRRLGYWIRRDKD